MIIGKTLSSLIRNENANDFQVDAQHVIIRLSLINPHNVRIWNDDDPTATQKLPATKSRSTQLIAQSEKRDNETNQPTDEAHSIRIVYLFIALFFLVWFHVARTIPKKNKQSIRSPPYHCTRRLPFLFFLHALNLPKKIPLLRTEPQGHENTRFLNTLR